MLSKKLAAIDKTRCVACGVCENTCPIGAVKVLCRRGGGTLRRLRQVREALSRGLHRGESEGRGMKKAKHWYDYLWVYAIIYFALGFFNILFAWLGMIDFLLPLFLAIFGGNKFFCNHLCGRGQLFSKLGTDLKCSRCKPTPRWMSSKWFRYSLMLTSLLLGLIVMVLYKPRTWCSFCPMGTMTQGICKLKNKE